MKKNNYRELTKEEIEWTKDVLQNRLGNKPSVKMIEELKLHKEYKQKFGKKIGSSGLYSRMFKLQNPDYKRQNRAKNPNKLFENASYIVYVKDVGVFGFETQLEVEQFLEKSKILGNVILFKKTNVSIKFDISIGG